MSTPAKTVQFRSVSSMITAYENVGIVKWGIKHGSNLNFKYQGEDPELAKAQLEAYAEMLEESKSAGIYTLCLYEDPCDRITEKTPVDLSWNFRLQDQTAGFLPGEEYRGGYGALMGKIAVLEKKLADRDQEPENKLGIVGEILEMEAVQPLMMALGGKIADWITGDGKVGELKRVSGISGVPAGPAAAPGQEIREWRNDPIMVDAIDRLNNQVEDLQGVLVRLANFSEKSPGKLKLYLAMIRKL